MSKKNPKDKEKKRKQLLTLIQRFLPWVLLLILAGSAFAGMNIWTGYRDSIIDQQKEQMFLNVQSLGKNLNLYIEECVEDIDSLCLIHQNAVERAGEASYRIADRKNQGDEMGWEIVQEYVQTHSPLIYDVVVEDELGHVLESVKGHQIQKISSITRMDENTSLLLATLDDGNMHLMIRRDLPDGTLTMMIHLENYYELLIRDLRIGSSGYVLVKDSAGVILIHPQSSQWGIQVIEDRKKLYPDVDLESLEQMIANQLAGKSGVEEYYSYWWMEEGHPRARKICAYVPVSLGEDFLVVSEVMDYDDIYVPIASGVLKLIVFFLVIFMLLAAMAFSVFLLMQQKKKDTEQIAYLTELNRLLEDMHRSEETIAHQQRLQIMGTMTGGIAHEFNNLLTPIMGYADLLMMELPEDSESYENALEIYEASAKAKEIIQQISSFSRKNMETAYKLTDAAGILKRALKMVRSICPANVSLREEISLKREQILCNETQMNQVILNICVNAFHAIGHQDGRLTVSACVQERNELEHARNLPEGWHSYLHIRISDNGCGMSPEILSQIFDPFFTTKKGGKGTGLGLALAEQIIHSHKGEIYAESQPQKGSTFHILLPVSTKKPLTQEEKVEENPEEIRRQVAGLRILVVDDNPKILNLLEKDAEKLRLPLTCCMNYEDALVLLEKGLKIDMVAAEQEINGKSVVDFLMAVQGQCPRIKAYVMLDRMTREIAQAKQRKLFNDCIDKPVSIASFLEAYRREERLNSL